MSVELVDLTPNLHKIRDRIIDLEARFMLNGFGCLSLLPTDDFPLGWVRAPNKKRIVYRDKPLQEAPFGVRLDFVGKLDELAARLNEKAIQVRKNLEDLDDE